MLESGAPKHVFNRHSGDLFGQYHKHNGKQFSLSHIALDFRFSSEFKYT